MVIDSKNTLPAQSIGVVGDRNALSEFTTAEMVKKYTGIGGNRWL